ncbi:MAG TPA: FIST N-terminal domain-containing protein [Candidatus Bathyarchaeia archaeon]|nr:FIST N-terminal domain-containing protein [Candidatus Bathyarchaeia archaeon]
MDLRIGIGFSQEENIVRATEIAAEQAKDQIGKKRIDLAILLTTPDYNPEEVIPIAASALNQTRIIGGTTCGIITPAGLKRHGISILAMNSDTIGIDPVHTDHLNLKNMEAAGSSFIHSSLSGFGQKERKLLFFFFDGLLENMSDFTKGIAKKAGVFFPTIALGTSDQFTFSKTHQYRDNCANTHSACGMVLGGDINFYMAARHGWKPLGRPRLVKKSKKNIIEQIGEAPAIQIYEEFFKDSLGSLKNDTFGKLNARYPLGIFTKHKEEYLLRNVTDILEDGSIVLQDEIPDKAEIHIMIANKASCLHSAVEAAEALKKQLGNQTPKGLLIFESAMRWRVLKHSWNQERAAIMHVLGKGFPIFGMMTYGEMFNSGTIVNAPGRNYLLNGNILLVAII